MTADLTGYERPDGRWGWRNHVLVLPLHSSLNSIADRIAEGVPGAVAIRHDWEGLSGDPDRVRIERTLVGFATNPNVGAVILVDLDGSRRAVPEGIAQTAQRFEVVSVASFGSMNRTVEEGQALAGRLAREASMQSRVPAPVSGICLGLECGGSDALSGITANPALGVASDLLVEAGGSSILAEISELLGAEHLLARRAVTPDVAEQVIEVVTRFEGEVARFGVDLRGSQPAPGNIEGGLTTIEEKSLGAAKKGGNGPIHGVLEYAENPSTHGLFIMDTPGHDIEQMVGMVAAGANIVAFTTGRGTPTGSPIAPCLKISTNSEIARACPDLIDLDAGQILKGTHTLDIMGRLIFDTIVDIAGGAMTKSELRGNREFALARIYQEGTQRP
ncbi:MAG: UxaA family hydrolase [Actinomycetota bacterium]